ncbi:MAG: bifunctional enoyl-CoA hydratase/phosphate acetyltransferase [Calditrichaeota bacterium]|nr:bifunctional enoyl-CoA hydratase/phosphate acetyltransferase [Calditrichota bacterium]RQV92565.1 MAG: bifunctional enoyl-CoA hydratase/phosphate acetyltransferase [bacterium]RQV99639.1 MAG: bifunctional enoyl-CoA hydratase/phosphate acetyltransferase [Calditrichota bacterium]
MVKSFSQLVDEVKSSKNRRISVAVAQDSDVLEALEKARKSGLADAILVGKQTLIEKAARDVGVKLSPFEILNIPDEYNAVGSAIQLIRDGKADVLMKGLCSTATLMKVVLDKEWGLRDKGLLSHLAIFEISSYHKLIFMSDAALNIAPSMDEKIRIAENAISVAHRLGLQLPKVAMIAAVEKINPEKMPATVDAALIAKMSERGQIEGAIIDGPLALDNAFSKKSCEIKGIVSEVGGDADIAIAPEIETGNVFYKLMSYLAGAKTAGLIIGAKVPIVLTSRADSDEVKFLSIATAARIS